MEGRGGGFFLHINQWVTENPPILHIFFYVYMGFIISMQKVFPPGWRVWRVEGFGFDCCVSL